MYIRRQADFGTGGFHEEAACPSQHWYRPSRIARCKPGRVGAVLPGRFGNGNCRRERARPSATSPGRLRHTRRPTVPGVRKSKKKLKTRSITNDYTFPHSICVYARGCWGPHTTVANQPRCSNPQLATGAGALLVCRFLPLTTTCGPCRSCPVRACGRRN